MPGAIGPPGPDSSHTGSFHRGGGATAGHGRDSQRGMAATGARVPRCVTGGEEPTGLRARLVDGIPDGMDDVATVLAEGFVNARNAEEACPRRSSASSCDPAVSS